MLFVDPLLLFFIQRRSEVPGFHDQFTCIRYNSRVMTGGINEKVEIDIRTIETRLKNKLALSYFPGVFHLTPSFVVTTKPLIAYLCTQRAKHNLNRRENKLCIT